jgi:hypothetical protein
LNACVPHWSPHKSKLPTPSTWLPNTPGSVKRQKPLPDAPTTT